MKILEILSFIVLLYGCQSYPVDTRDKGKSEGSVQWSVSDKIKKAIQEKSIGSFPENKIYGVTVIRLKNETILNVCPVRGNDFIRINGKPATFYEFNGLFYLIYCGMESMNGSDSGYVGMVQKKLDNTCLKNGVTNKGNIIHDDPPLFAKVQNDTLVPYEMSGSKEFYMIYNGIKEEKSPFVPPVIK